MYEAGVESPDFRNYGIDETRPRPAHLGRPLREIAGRQKTVEERDILSTRFSTSPKLKLIDTATDTFMKLTWEGRKAAQDIFPSGRRCVR
jgi:hypothetical protein